MLQTTVAGISLHCCIYNASGPRSGSKEALEKIASSSAGAVVSKSSTLEKRHGNVLPRFVESVHLNTYCAGSFSAEGLPNFGIDYCKFYQFFWTVIVLNINYI